MTVEDIKEYVDNKLNTCAMYDQTRMYLKEVKSMLDELEPKAKWKHDGSQWENRFICSKCGHKIFEEQQPYCSNCGARMEVEDDTTPTNV